jgi:hypothetical protein
MSSCLRNLNRFEAHRFRGEKRRNHVGCKFVLLPPHIVALEGMMDGIIYLIGLIVVVLAILSFLGLR